MRSARLALGLLTAVPVGDVTPEETSAGRALLWAPVAGCVAALPSLVLIAAATRPPVVVAGLAIGLLAVMTRALHWDGLADTADAFAVPAGRGDPLSVMAQPDIGPSGALALALVALLQVSALAALIGQGCGVRGLALAVIVSRGVLPWVCAVGTPAAKSSGLGALVVGRVPRWPAYGVTALVVASGLGYCAPARGVAAALAGCVVAVVLRRVAIRRFAGLTGDVLGAVVETAATACLIGLAIAR